MIDRRHILFLLCFILWTASPAVSQDADLTQGVAAMTAHNLPLARHLLEAAVGRDSNSYEANWRLASVLCDLGKQTPDQIKSPARDSLYATAVRYARRAVAAKSDGADGHFVLGLAFGRTSQTLGARDRIKLATVIRNEELEAIRINPSHDGAYHVLGRWNAEIMRLPGLQKFFARTFLGASVFNQASWDNAEHYMALSVQHDPRRIIHRLDLARVLMDRSKWRAATAQVDTLLTLPTADPMDPSYQREARALLPRLSEKLAK